MCRPQEERPFLLDRPATRAGGMDDGSAGVVAAGPDGGAAHAPDGRAADAPDGGAAHAQDDGAAAARSDGGAAAGDGCNVARDRAAAPSVIVPADRVQLSSSLSPRPHVCVFAAVHKLSGPSMKQVRSTCKHLSGVVAWACLGHRLDI